MKLFLVLWIMLYVTVIGYAPWCVWVWKQNFQQEQLDNLTNLWKFSDRLNIDLVKVKEKKSLLLDNYLAHLASSLANIKFVLFTAKFVLFGSSISGPRYNLDIEIWLQKSIGPENYRQFKRRRIYNDYCFPCSCYYCHFVMFHERQLWTLSTMQDFLPRKNQSQKKNPV